MLLICFKVAKYEGEFYMLCSSLCVCISITITVTVTVTVMVRLSQTDRIRAGDRDGIRVRVSP